MPYKWTYLARLHLIYKKNKPSFFLRFYWNNLEQRQSWRVAFFFHNPFILYASSAFKVFIRNLKITEVLFSFVIKETIACFWKILLKIRIIQKKYKKTKLVKKQISGSTKKISEVAILKNISILIHPVA